MRQPGVGSQGGAEALAIFHQLLYDERASGTYATPLAGIKVDEKNGVGTIAQHVELHVGTFLSCASWHIYEVIL